MFFVEDLIGAFFSQSTYKLTTSYALFYFNRIYAMSEIDEAVNWSHSGLRCVLESRSTVFNNLSQFFYVCHLHLFVELQQINGVVKHKKLWHYKIVENGTRGLQNKS